MMFNPFSLAGPDFLAFYLLLGIALNVALRVWIRRRELGRRARVSNNTNDPYRIAYLRKGGMEAVKVATIALVDRRLLDADGEVLMISRSDAVEFAHHPIEQAVLRYFSIPKDAVEMLRQAGSLDACLEYERNLTEDGLLADYKVIYRRFVPVASVFITLAWFSLHKFQVALAHGRHNLFFLFVFTVLALISASLPLFKRTTARGDALLADLKQLFARLKRRAAKLSAGGQANEAALLAAVFGIGALPAANFSFARTLYPSNNASCGSGGGCGSGSSCGGGGCGGGCGGCGS